MIIMLMRYKSFVLIYFICSIKILIGKLQHKQEKISDYDRQIQI